jgi:hypothetical protein
MAMLAKDPEAAETARLKKTKAKILSDVKRKERLKTDPEAHAATRAKKVEDHNEREAKNQSESQG